MRALVRVWHLRVVDLMYAIPRQRKRASFTCSYAFTYSYAILHTTALGMPTDGMLSKLRVLVVYLVLGHWCGEFSQCSGIPRAAEIMTLKTASAT